MRYLHAHACWRDKQCQSHGAPKRLYVITPVGSLILALRRDDWTQLWLPWKTAPSWAKEPTRYSRWSSPVVFHPRSRRRKP